MRKLKRSIAKANLRDAGYPKLCKRYFFRRVWREWINPAPKYRRIIERRKRAREARTKKARGAA